MPVKSVNTTAKPLTKTIYINWSEQEVYSQEEYEKRINEALTEMLEDESLVGEWLTDNLSYHDIGRLMLDEEYRAEVMVAYDSYCRERIKDDEEGEWEEVNVTF